MRERQGKVVQLWRLAFEGRSAYVALACNLRYDILKVTDARKRFQHFQEQPVSSIKCYDPMKKPNFFVAVKRRQLSW
jgi:hypothetical protein